MRSFLQVLFLILIDIGAYYCSLFLGWATREFLFPAMFNELRDNYSFYYYVCLWWIPVIYIFFFSYVQIYTSRYPFWDETKRLINALTLSMLVLMTVVTLGHFPDKVSRPVLILLWVNSLFIFPILRLFGKELLFKSGIFRERVLILGAGKAGRLILSWLTREKHLGYDVLGFLDDDPDKIGNTIDGKKIFGKIKHYTKFIREFQVNTIILAMPSLGPEKLSTMSFEIQQHVKNTMIVPDLYGVALLNTDLLHLFYEEIFLLKVRNNLKSLSNRIVKRIFDLAVSIALLPFLLFLIVIIGIIIKLESSAPVFYAHERIGRGMKVFRCYKFRTMVKDAEDKLVELLKSDANIKDEWEKYWKLKNDPRVTRIGMFLRKTSLDELPQIFNVLKGQMSFIGPRPYLLRELDEIKDGIEAITKVSPGITGLWQVSGRNSTTYKYRLRLDLWYIINWSLWLDLVILIRTITVVISMKGVK
ncbi:UDP-phosphate galactose phosphotransferase [Candidatus Magnetoovum chiemensis]|nr:UDP-phosphate galactose phosphotransferase [Candidatus Magnetoovum chiemensis]